MLGEEKKYLRHFYLLAVCALFVFFRVHTQFIFNRKSSLLILQKETVDGCNSLCTCEYVDVFFFFKVVVVTKCDTLLSDLLVGEPEIQKLEKSGRKVAEF